MSFPLSTLTLRLEGDAKCVGGTVRIANTTLDPILEKAATVPSSGVVTFKGISGQRVMPNGQALNGSIGLAIDMECPTWPFTNARPTVVMRYQDVLPGQTAPVGDLGAPPTSKGSWCWAGSWLGSLELTVLGHVKDAGSVQGNSVALWVDPMQHVTVNPEKDKWQSTYGGGLGNQELPYC